MEKIKMSESKVKELIKEEVEKFNVSGEYNNELITEIKDATKDLDKKIAKFLVKSKKIDKKIYESNLLKVNERLSDLKALINSLEKE